MPVRRIHQFFFNFDGRRLEDFELFVQSHQAYKSIPGWQYKLWGEGEIEALCRERYPKIWPEYQKLRFPIQKLDLGKYIVADACGGIISDLDVIPISSDFDRLVGDSHYIFDRCTRRHVIANDFFYVGEDGLPGIFDYFLENIRRVDSIPAYRQRKMRYIFHSTGPDFLTRYLKKSGLARYARAISNRTFLDPRQRHRDVTTRGAVIQVVHQLSWADQVR